MAGFVTQRLARLPVAGDTVDVDGHRLTVTRLDGRRVAVLHADPRPVDSRRPRTTADLRPAPTPSRPGCRHERRAGPGGLLVALLAGNAFFVAAEFALVSARVDQIEPRAAAGSARAVRTLAAMRNVSQMMAGAQLGITLCSLGLGAVGEPAVAHLDRGADGGRRGPGRLLHPVALVVALALVTVLHMVLGEMVPKNITIAGPDRAAIALGPPMAKVVTVLKPLIWFFNVTANGFVRLFGVTPTDEVSASFDSSEIRSMITQSRSQGLLGERGQRAGRRGADVREPRRALGAGALGRPGHRGPRHHPAGAGGGRRRARVQPLPAVRAGRWLWSGYVHVKDVLGAADAGQPAARRRGRALRRGWPPTSRCPRCCRRCAGPGCTWAGWSTTAR